MKNNVEETKKIISSIEECLPELEADKVKNQEKIKKLIKKVDKYIEELPIEIKANILSLMPQSVSQDEEATTRLRILKDYFKLNNNYTSVNQLMDFYLILDQLENPTDLDYFNDVLKKLITKFHVYQLDLTIDDFNFTKGVFEYMSVFFKNLNSEDLNDIMHKKFDMIYWKDHNLLKEIIVNVRLIILKQKDMLVKAIKKNENEYVATNNINEETALEELLTLKKKEIESKLINPTGIITLFSNGSLKISDYKDDTSFKKNIATFMDIKEYNELNEEKKEELYVYMYDLYNNLNEYNEYEKYSYLISQFTKIFEKKAELKGTLALKNKSITSLLATKEKLDKEIGKLNNDLGKTTNKKTSLFMNEEKKQQKIISLVSTIASKQLEEKKQVELILEEYQNYDIVKFEDEISNVLLESNTINDIFVMLGENKNILKKYIRDHNPKFSNEEILTNIEEFDNFIFNPYIQIISTISFTKPEELNKIIEEKYRLLGIKMTLNTVTTASLMESVHSINTYISINKSGLSGTLIELICKNIFKL